MKANCTKVQTVGGLVYITFNLQKTLPLPNIPTSVAFYLRQLWFYSLGVHLVGVIGENGYMQTWLKNETGRGANEIIRSELLAFFEAAHEEIDQSHGLILAADETKIFTVVTFWQYLLTKNICSDRSQIS